MAAVCEVCKQEMQNGGACTVELYVIGGQDYARVPHNGDRNCPDCGVAPGQLHHPGCDTERCPKCGGQSIGCFCDDPDGLADLLEEMKVFTRE